MAWPFGNKEGEEAKKELDAFIDRIGMSVEQKLEEKLKPMREEITSVKTKWEALEKAAENAEGNGSGGNGGDDGRGGNGEENLTEDQRRDLANRKMLALTIATNARITEGEIIGDRKSTRLNSSHRL